MTLTGEYTQAGAAIAAKIQAGSASLQITRAAAGTGRTEASQTDLGDKRQELALYAGSLEGNTYTVPARLNSTEAGGAYSLTEIGLYAMDSSGKEVLYKIYRFDHSISISPQCQLIATFYLNDTIASGSTASVTVTPSGLMTARDVEDMIAAADYTTPQNVNTLISTGLATLPVFNPSPVSISCTAANLQSTINALPKILNTKTTITVSAGTYSGNLILHDFMGSGSLTITGPTSGTVTISGYMDVFNCRLAYVVLDYLTVKGSSMRACGVRSYGSAAVSIRDCHMVRVEKVTVSMPTTVSGIGFFLQRTSCIFGYASVQGRAYGIVAHMFCRISMRNMQSNAFASCTCSYYLDGCCTMQLPGALSNQGWGAGSSSYSQTACCTTFYGTACATGGGIVETHE